MLSKRRLGLAGTVCAVGVVLTGMAVSAQTSTGVPVGWRLHGSRSEKYECGVDADMKREDKPSAFLRGKAAAIAGDGEFVQYLSPEKYLGQRLQLSGWLKTKDVPDLAGLWMRVGGAGGEMLGFDNMENRPVKGTTDWTKYTVVLDVPPDAKDITFGFALYGPGEVWANGFSLDTADKNMPTTNLFRKKQLPAQPFNMDFTVGR